MERQIERWAEKIKKLELDIRNKDDNKEVALGTSKINYMDPRISVAWCKRVEVPIEKIFAKTLRDKVGWLSVCLSVSPSVTGCPAWRRQRLTPVPTIPTQTHTQQFVWAMGVPPTWRFEGKKKKESKE